MKIIGFILISVLIHTLVLVYVYLPFKVLPTAKFALNTLEVQLIQNDEQQPKTKNKRINLSENSNLKFIESQQQNIKNLEDAENHQKPIETRLESTQITSDTRKTDDKLVIKNLVTGAQDSFLSGNEVDRKALPQTALDSEKLLKNLSSGLPIRLRLYINSFGRLVKIERIGVQEQDLLFVEQLEQQLYKITFLPAVRNGVSISSYQEIQFNFSQNSAIESN